MKALNNFDQTDGEYLTTPNDDLIRFWRSRVKVTARRGEGTNVDAGASKSHILFYELLPVD